MVHTRGRFVLGCVLGLVALALLVQWLNTQAGRDSDVQAGTLIARDGVDPSPDSKVPEPDADAPASQPAAGVPPDYHPPRTDERKHERGRMVDTQIEARGIRSEPIVEAMRNVPRHWFVPRAQQSSAYRDYPLPIGHGQTISQPYIVALMTESLNVKEGDRVLEVGTGSGYQAAVLAELTPNVFTIEIVKPLADRAAEVFKERSYPTVQSRQGDGYFGWEEHAPFDAIIVTCAASHIPPALIQQLKPGGRMCIPVGGPFSTQRLLLVTRQADGTTKSKSLELVRFVPMTGQIEAKR